MKDLLTGLFARIQCLMIQDEGQDLVEYALVVALIAFGATSSIKVLGTDLNTVFNNIGTKLTSTT
jgi:pilus assembly protein Flp/PilA